MSAPEREDITSPPAREAKDSDRRGWLVATCIAVVLIIAAWVFLVTRTNDDPGMPGMDMGSEQRRESDAGTADRFDAQGPGTPIGLERPHEVGVA